MYIPKLHFYVYLRAHAGPGVLCVTIIYTYMSHRKRNFEYYVTTKRTRTELVKIVRVVDLLRNKNQKKIKPFLNVVEIISIRIF